MNPIQFDLGEAFDTVSHEVRIVKSTVTYVATRTTTATYIATRVKKASKKNTGYIYQYVKKRTTRNSIQPVFKSNTEIIHTVIIKFAQNINGGWVKRANEGEPIDLVQLAKR